MSTFYDTEPQPTASVVFHTTGGEIAVELFAKQTPLTSRNFLQHCLDGFYDNTIFHRLVPGFILQGGDPTGTGNGGESIYDNGALSGDLDPWPMDQRRGQNAGHDGIGFKDEYHTRLKFNRRGLLAMANEGKHDTNSSQFFFTLDKTEELNGRNTLFGRVAGATIYNLAKMGEADVEEGSERPMYPVQIKTIEIVTNPFTEMRKTERTARRYDTQEAQKQSAAEPDKKRKRKKGVNKTLLSFGDDMEDDEAGDLDADVPRTNHKKARVDKESRRKKEDKSKEGKEDTPLHSTLPSRAALDKSAQPVPSPQKPQSVSKLSRDVADDYASESDSESQPPKKKQSALDKTNAEIAALKASMRRDVQGKELRGKLNEEKEDKRSDLEKMIPKNAGRGKRFSHGKTLSGQDPRTLKLLSKFQTQLEEDAENTLQDASSRKKSSSGNDSKGKSSKNGSASAEGEEVVANKPDDGAEDGEVCDLHFIVNCQSCRPWDKKRDNAHNGGAHGYDNDNVVNSDDDDENDGDWMAHTLSCVADKLGKDLSYRKKAEEELLVIDPREKARALKEEKRAGRDGRSSGSSGRSWDKRRSEQAQAAKMARASALSGRGAK